MARRFARAWSFGTGLLVLVALAATACRDVPAPERKLPPLRVARSYWPGEYWIDIAAQKGWFKEAGLDVELIDANPDYLQSMRDVAEGRLDTQNFALFDLVSYNLHGYELCGFLYADTSYGAESIVAAQTIKTAGDLNGKRIALPANSYLEYILDAFLDRERLNSERITVVDTPGERAAELFARGEVDAAFTWEPYATEALGVAGSHRLFTSSEIPGISPALLTARRKTITERPDDFQKYVAVWKRATDLIKSSPDEAFRIIAEIYNVPIKDVAAFAETDRIMDLNDNRIAFAYAAGHESLHGSAIRINEYLIERERASRRLDTLDILDDRFIRMLK